MRLLGCINISCWTTVIFAEGYISLTTGSA